MQLLDGGMFAFSAFHALKDRRALPLTWQVPLMVAKVVEDTGDGVAVCWNGERQWKRDRMPGYRPRPEIWQTATRRDFELMLRVLAGLGVLQFRTDEHEADEILAMLVHALEGQEPVLIRSDDNLELTDLGRTAVGDRPPPPLADGYAARDFVRDTGEREGIPHLQGSNLDGLFEAGVAATRTLHERGLF